MQEITVMKSEERSFQKFAKRASRLTPDSTTEEIDAVFKGANKDSLSEFDSARLLCLIYGYIGVFGKAPLPYLGLLARAFDLPATTEIQPIHPPLATPVSYKDHRRRHRSR
jgi:hypothetical protein